MKNRLLDALAELTYKMEDSGAPRPDDVTEKEWQEFLVKYPSEGELISPSEVSDLVEELINKYSMTKLEKKLLRKALENHYTNVQKWLYRDFIVPTLVESEELE